VKGSGWDAARGGSYRLRSVLVVSELAVSMMLLIGAGLLMKASAMWHVDPGFSAANVLGMRISLPESQYAGSRERAVLYRELVDRILALPALKAPLRQTACRSADRVPTLRSTSMAFRPCPASHAIQITGP